MSEASSSATPSASSSVSVSEGSDSGAPVKKGEAVAHGPPPKCVLLALELNPGGRGALHPTAPAYPLLFHTHPTPTRTRSEISGAVFNMANAVSAPTLHFSFSGHCDEVSTVPLLSSSSYPTTSLSLALPPPPEPSVPPSFFFSISPHLPPICVCPRSLALAWVACLTP